MLGMIERWLGEWAGSPVRKPGASFNTRPSLVMAGQNQNLSIAMNPGPILQHGQPGTFAVTAFTAGRIWIFDQLERGELRCLFPMDDVEFERSFLDTDQSISIPLGDTNKCFLTEIENADAHVERGMLIAII